MPSESLDEGSRKVAGDAARMLEQAARRLRAVAGGELRSGNAEQRRLVEALGQIGAAEARIHGLERKSK